MNPKPKNPNKAKHKARRKANERRIQTAKSNTDKSIAKWLKDYYESRPEYPTTKTKRLTKEQLRKFFKIKPKRK